MKRVLWLALAVLLLAAPAALAEAAPAEAPAVALDVGDGCALIGGDGSELVAPGLYSNIEALRDRPPYRYAAYQIDGEEPEFAKVLDGRGEPLTDFAYHSLHALGDKICFEQDGRYGVMDEDLSVLVPNNYTNIIDNGEGGYLALTTDPFDDRADGVYHIDGGGKETATGSRVFYGLTEFSDGLMSVLSGETGRAGYLNARGEWAIPAQFRYGGPFVNGMAEAAVDSGAGLIDTSGNWMVSPKYETLSLQGAASMLVAQTDSTRISLIDTKTLRPVREFTGRDIYYASAPDSPLVAIYLDDEMLLVDGQGRDILAASGTEGSIECDEARVILREGPWGEKNAYLCDLSGKRLAGPYQDIWRVSARSGAPYYAYSSFETQSEAWGEGDHLYLNEVPGTRRSGLMDQDGALLWPEDDYREVYSAVDGLFAVQTAEAAGVVRADGQWLARYGTAEDAEDAEDES